MLSSVRVAARCPVLRCNQEARRVLKSAARAMSTVKAKVKKSNSGSVPRLPIVYSPKYNIGFLGLERLHPFDSRKYEKVHGGLIKSKLVRSENFTAPDSEVSHDTLLHVHSEDYLNSLNWSYNVAGLVEVPPVAVLPNFLVQRKLLSPMRWATAGSLLAAKLALEHKWAINLSGGYHHASAEKGGGFCVYADISLTVLEVHREFPHIKRFMIVDLDAHQGNGHSEDNANGVFKPPINVHVFDVFNSIIFPNDVHAQTGITCAKKLHSGCDDTSYMEKIVDALPEEIDKFEPDLIVYNAGTDILVGDQLGRMDISQEGIIKRDEIVFEAAFARDIPVVMLLSGGYQQNNAAVITKSILNLNEKFNMFAPIIGDYAESKPSKFKKKKTKK